MKRIRTLGLVALAALAVTASIGVASASASGFVANKYTALLEAPTKSGSFNLKAAGMSISCDGPGISGSIGAATESFTPTVTAASCYPNGSKKPLNMNGCGFTFHPGAEASVSQFNGTFDIGPAGCGPISLEYNKGCIVSLSPKTGLNATYYNQGTGTGANVAIAAQATGLKETLTGSGGCSKGTGENGSLTGTWEVKATVLGVPTGLHVSSGTYGIYLAGEKSAEKAKQPRLEAEKYPALISAAQSSTNLPSWSMGTSTITCQEAQFNTEASAATAELSVAATYGKCAMAGVYSVKVRMNGCYFVYHILNVGPPYAGAADIACAKEGEAIEARAYSNAKFEAEDKPICVEAFGSQTSATGVGLENASDGAARVVSVNTSLSGLSHTYTTLSIIQCPPTTGSSTDGKYTSGMVLHGGSF